MTAAFERSFERLRDGYAKLLAMLLRRRAIIPIVAMSMLGLGAVMLLSVGRDFFPLIDGGQIQLHVRAPAGTRIESTEAIFQAADIVTQILNFGLPAQIDVRTVGYDKNNLSVARKLRERLAAIPGIADAHLQQEVDAPAFYAQIDRTRAAQLGLNASTVATNINVSLSSSEQVSPNFWTDPTSGIPYYLAVQTPEYRINSLNALANTPVSTSLAVSGQTVPGMLSNVATFKRDKVATNSNQTNIQPVFDIYASVQGRDLGSVAADINKVTTELQKTLKPGNSIQVIGQIQSMNDSFRNL